MGKVQTIYKTMIYKHRNSTTNQVNLFEFIVGCNETSHDMIDINVSQHPVWSPRSRLVLRTTADCSSVTSSSLSQSAVLCVMSFIGGKSMQENIICQIV